VTFLFIAFPFRMVLRALVRARDPSPNQQGPRQV